MRDEPHDDELLNAVLFRAADPDPYSQIRSSTNAPGLDPANWSTSSANFWVFSLQREEYPNAEEAIFRRADSVRVEAG